MRRHGYLSGDFLHCAHGEAGTTKETTKKAGFQIFGGFRHQTLAPRQRSSEFPHFACFWHNIYHYFPSVCLAVRLALSLHFRWLAVPHSRPDPLLTVPTMHPLTAQ